jgi:hypothetical protein
VAPPPPARTYSISSDLTHASRIEVPVVCYERRIIAPHQTPFLQVNIPQFLSPHSRDAPITSLHSRVAPAYSLVRFNNRKYCVQVVNCSPRQKKVGNGRLLARADLYAGDTDTSTRGYPLTNQPFDEPPYKLSPLPAISNERTSLSHQSMVGVLYFEFPSLLQPSGH